VETAAKNWVHAEGQVEIPGNDNQILYNRKLLQSQFVQCVIHIENPTRCNSVSKFYFIFI
jgi:hypothetical protein